MKRVLLIALVLLLLVSCASSQVKTTEPQTPQTTIESAEVAGSVEVPEAAETTEIPQAVEEQVDEAVPEEAAPPIVTEEPEVIENNDQITVIQEVVAIEPTEAEVEKAPSAEETPSDEQDWGQVIGSALAAEAEAEKPAETEVTVHEKATEVKDEAAQVEVQSTSVSPRKASFVDKLTFFVKRVGNFVAQQILMSIGLLVCFIGLIYLFVALIINARRTRERDRYASRRQRTDNGESDSFRPGSDEDPETDDAFLRSLLGDDNN